MRHHKKSGTLCFRLRCKSMFNKNFARRAAFMEFNFQGCFLALKPSFKWFLHLQVNVHPPLVT